MTRFFGSSMFSDPGWYSMSAFTIVPRPQSVVTDSSTPRPAALFVSAAIGLLAATAPWSMSEPWWVEACVTAVLLVSVAAVFVDLTSERIPDRVVVVGLFPTAVALVAGVASAEDRADALEVFLGAAGFALPLLVMHLVAPAALGFGDVKLAASLGAAVGLVDWRLCVVSLCIASGVTAAVALAGRRSTMPFAPGLVAGAALVFPVPLFVDIVPWR